MPGFGTAILKGFWFSFACIRTWINLMLTFAAVLLCSPCAYLDVPVCVVVSVSCRSLVLRSHRVRRK